MSGLHRAEDVAAELAARIATRTIAQGAETDAGATVYQGRRHISDDLIPCTTIIEADDAPQRGRVVTEYENQQRYILFSYVPCSPANPNLAAHAAIRDLKRAIFLTDGRASADWGRKVKEVAYMGKDIGPRSDGAAYVVAAVEIVVTFVERLHQP